MGGRKTVRNKKEWKRGGNRKENKENEVREIRERKMIGDDSEVERGLVKRVRKSRLRN